jgi:hypothetical protein
VTRNPGFVWFYVYDSPQHDPTELAAFVKRWFYTLDRFVVAEVLLGSSRFYMMEGNVMVDKKSKASERDVSPFIGFVNITLTDVEYASVDEAISAKKPPDLGMQLDYFLEFSKLSLSFVRGALNVTATIQSGKSAGYAVSAFSDNLLEALLILRMKTTNYLDEFPQLYLAGGVKRKRG